MLDLSHLDTLHALATAPEQSSGSPRSFDAYVKKANARFELAQILVEKWPEIRGLLPVETGRLLEMPMGWCDGTVEPEMVP